MVNVNWNADNRKWNVNAWKLDENGNWNAGNRVFRNNQNFSPTTHVAGEFCFSVCPSQPPSIRPISSMGIERSSYFFVSMERVSHKISRRILSVSNFAYAGP